jgi:hypothetical protein
VSPRVIIFNAFLIGSTAVLRAQTPPVPPQLGIEPDWDIAQVLQKIAAHAQKLAPFLDKINASAWIEKGASETYAAQLDSSRQQVRAVADSASALTRNPQKLSASLDLLFRIQSVETMLTSLQEGVRKYQSPSDAQTLARLVAENGSNRDRLQHYIVNLAAEREQDLQVMDREAQRCRAMLTQAPNRSQRKK